MWRSAETLMFVIASIDATLARSAGGRPLISRLYASLACGSWDYDQVPRREAYLDRQVLPYCVREACRWDMADLEAQMHGRHGRPRYAGSDPDHVWRCAIDGPHFARAALVIDVPHTRKEHRSRGRSSPSRTQSGLQIPSLPARSARHARSCIPTTEESDPGPWLLLASSSGFRLPKFRAPKK